MGTTSIAEQRPPGIDQILLMHSARLDRWRDIVHLAAGWASGRSERAALEAAVGAMAPIEEYHAYPGAHLLGRSPNALRATMPMALRNWRDASPTR